MSSHESLVKQYEKMLKIIELAEKSKPLVPSKVLDINVESAKMCLNSLLIAMNEESNHC
jgi:hypothetical protein